MSLLIIIFSGFHLLAARHVETEGEGIDLAFRGQRITVAGQRRTCTGFVIEPSHPGERRLTHSRFGLLRCNVARITQKGDFGYDF